MYPLYDAVATGCYSCYELFTSSCAGPSLQCSQTALFFCPLNLIPEMRGAFPQIKRRPSRPFPI
jgi:hypothetical protein